MSRDTILNNIRASQPQGIAKPAIPVFHPWFEDPVQKFAEVAKAIGSEVHFVNGYDEVLALLKSKYPDKKRMITAVEPLLELSDTTTVAAAADYHDVDLYIIETRLAVAENGAVWITENELKERVLPFIAQELAVIVRRQEIVATMHDAYEAIGDAQYGFAAFIAGPSKTADIEQSLVLGAHGPKSLTAFII